MCNAPCMPAGYGQVFDYLNVRGQIMPVFFFFRFFFFSFFFECRWPTAGHRSQVFTTYSPVSDDSAAGHRVRVFASRSGDVPRRGGSPDPAPGPGCAPAPFPTLRRPTPRARTFAVRRIWSAPIANSGARSKQSAPLIGRLLRGRVSPLCYLNKGHR